MRRATRLVASRVFDLVERPRKDVWHCDRRRAAQGPLHAVVRGERSAARGADRSLLALAAVLSGTVFPLISASRPAAASQLGDLQAKASQLEQQITSETQQIGVLGQRFDQLSEQIGTLNGEIATTKDQIAADTKRVATDKDNLRTVAINAY